MTDLWTRLAKQVRTGGNAALITVLDIRGSAPREAGARMIVAADGTFSGTIGGGQLEWEAIQLTAGRLRAGSTSLCLTDFALGPDLGQCCGGRVDIAVELFGTADLPVIEEYAGLEASGGFACEARFDPARPHALRRLSVSAGKDESSADEAGLVCIDPDRRVYREEFDDARHPLLLFGAGHVGRALVLALAPLPFRVTWVDSRPDAFPAAMPQNVTAVRARNPADLVAEAPAGAFVLVMTHSHPLDLELCRAALSRGNLPHVGVIGSETKRARFRKRLRESGLGDDDIARLRCPIGIEGIAGKAPPVIAASVAAELLRILKAVKVGKSNAGTGYPQETEGSENLKSAQKQEDK